MTDHCLALVPLTAAGTPLVWTAPVTPLTPGTPVLPGSLAQKPRGGLSWVALGASLEGWHPLPVQVGTSVEVRLETQPKRGGLRQRRDRETNQQTNNQGCLGC